MRLYLWLGRLTKPHWSLGADVMVTYWPSALLIRKFPGQEIFISIALLSSWSERSGYATGLLPIPKSSTISWAARLEASTLPCHHSMSTPGYGGMFCPVLPPLAICAAQYMRYCRWTGRNVALIL